jgi:hypothetical protein
MCCRMLICVIDLAQMCDNVYLCGYIICMWVCGCVCIYIYIHTYIHTYIYIYIKTHTYEDAAGC